MSNHASRARVRRYAWQFAGFQQWASAAGEQARIEQQIRKQEKTDQ